MKVLLIALLALSCGKKEEPKALDFSDSDGDQRLNYQEQGLDKHVANFEVLGPVDGVLRIQGDKLIETGFTNQNPLGNRISDFLVGNEDRMMVDGFLDENSRLHLAQKLPVSFSATAATQVVIRFSVASAQADEIVLVTPQTQVLLASWAREVKLNFSAEQLEALIRGEAYLAVRRRPTRGKFFTTDAEQSIRKKSYRVYLHDGKVGTAYYISRELPYEEFLRAQGITPFVVTSEDVFFFSDLLVPKEGWFQRELRNGDRIVMRGRFDELRARFLSRFTERKIVLERINGVPTSSLAFENSAGAKVYVRIRSGEQVTRRFKELKEVRTHAQDEGREGSGSTYYDCKHYLRRIDDEQKQTASLAELMTHLVNGVELFEKSTVSDGVDADGEFWEVKLENLAPQTELRLASRPEETFTVTGEYRNNCRGKVRRRRGDARERVNSEGKLSFLLESYVEKLD
jgi:hypothetical protein